MGNRDSSSSPERLNASAKGVGGGGGGGMYRVNESDLRLQNNVIKRTAFNVPFIFGSPLGID